MSIKSHKDLIVWQKAMALTAECYKMTKRFPADERFRVTDQLLRAAASVPGNIAEGHARGTRREYMYFLRIARGSLAETETFFQLATDVGLVPDAASKATVGLASETGRLLNGLLTKLRLPATDPLNLLP